MNDWLFCSIPFGVGVFRFEASCSRSILGWEGLGERRSVDRSLLFLFSFVAFRVRDDGGKRETRGDFLVHSGNRMHTHTCFSASFSVTGYLGACMRKRAAGS